jgi:hypothetical protein
MPNLLKNESSVSEVLGTILILGIAVALFSALYIIVLSEPFDSSEPYPTVVAFVEGDHLVIEHRGGDELGVDSFFTFSIGDVDHDLEIGLLLDDINSDGKWNVGERLIITNDTIDAEIFDWANSNANIFGIDEENNRAILTGSLDIRPSGDIGLDYSIDKKNPKVGDTVNITLTVSLFYSDLSVPNIKIMFKLPDELEFLNKYPLNAGYNNDTGIWNISNLNAGDFAILTVKAMVSTKIAHVVPTQLLILMDGSGSISGPGGNQYGPDWNLCLNGLSDAINNSMPRTGDIEFTVIQFANSRASLELGPVMVTDTIGTSGYYKTVSEKVRAITQNGSNTPMACGFICGSDKLKDSLNKPTNAGEFERRVVILVTDGVPTRCCCIGDKDPYIEENCRWEGCYYSDATDNPAQNQNTVDARDYLIQELNLNSNEDEINSLAVGIGGMYGGPDSEWLKTSIVWPNSYLWIDEEPPGPGWVREVNDWQNFSQAIDETFIELFGEINFQIGLFDTPLIDLNNDNDIVTIEIKPQSKK